MRQSISWRLWRLPLRLSACPGITGRFVLLIATIVLAGWILDIPTLKSIAPQWPKMSPLTALCFFLMGAIVWLAGSIEKPGFGRASHVVTGIAAAVAVIALIRLILHWTGGNTAMDGLWIFSNSDGRPPRMSPATAFSFFLLSTSLGLAARRVAFGLYQTMTVVCGVIVWLGFSRYLYGGQPLVPYTTMAMHTALTFLVLTTGVLTLWRDRGLTALLASDTMGGLMARRLLIPAILLPTILGWLRLQAQYAGWFGLEAGLTLFALSNVVVFSTLIWGTAARLHRSDLDRIQANEKLTSSLKLIDDLRAALDEHAIVAITDPQGKITFVNDKFCEISKFSREELIGQDHRVVNSHFHSPEFIRNLWTTIARGKVWKGEIRNRAKDGSVYWVDTTIVPFLKPDGKPYQYVAIRADITQRKLAEEKALAQLDRLNLLHEITRSISERQDLSSIFQVTLGRVEEQLPVDFCCVLLYEPLNQQLTVSCVGKKSEALGRNMGLQEHTRVAIDPNGLSRCVRGQLVYEPNIHPAQFPFPQRLSRGGLGSLVVSPLQAESQVFGVLVAARYKQESFSSGECEFIRQLSEHVALASHQAQLYGALQRAYDDLRTTQQAVLQQERLRSLGEMASGIAHDINNALSPATLYLSLLLDRPAQRFDPQTKEYLDITRRAIDDVAATVARMKEFYRPRETQLNLEKVDLNQMVRQVIELTRVRWSNIPQQQGFVIDISTELMPDLPKIAGVASEIREALINVVFNAVDAMPSGGTLTFRTGLGEQIGDEDIKRRQRWIYVEVQDSGSGMDEETKKRCFEPFFTTKGERGTGLGMAMVYGVTQRHNATIDVDSTPGKGTTVRLGFGLPSEESLVSEPAKNGATATIPRQRQRILVIDDDPLLLKTLRDALELEGHHVVAGQGGQAGIDAFREGLAQKKPFSLVITDLGMPRIDGRQVSATIKSLSPETPVILLTGWGERLTIEGDIPPHVDKVLSKPPRITELSDAVSEMTSGKPRSAPEEDRLPDALSKRRPELG